MITSRCNQCGATRADDQDLQDTMCPYSAMPEPYSSCDGTLVQEVIHQQQTTTYNKPVSVRPAWYDVDMLEDYPE